MTKFTFETEDPKTAASIMALLSGETPVAAKPKETKIVKESSSPVAVDTKASAPESLVPAATGVDAAPTPAANVPVEPAAPAVPGAPTPASPAVASDALTEEDQAALDAGWTVNHIKEAATAHVQKTGSSAGFAAILAKYGAERVSNGPKSLVPRHYPAVHAELVA